MHKLFAILTLAACTACASAADNWPEYRGPTGDGHAVAKNLPIQWSETENIRWKTAIHDKGWSSPVVWGQQIWLTTARADGKELYAVCVDRDSGKILHDIKVYDIAKPAFCHPFNSYASPTPVVEEGRVYLHFGTYGTCCLDSATGKKLWERLEFHCDHWRGPGASPILHENLLFLSYDGYDTQFLVALDKTDGKTVWKRDRDVSALTSNGDLKKAYSTPSIVKVDGKAQLVFPGSQAHMGYDPKTGAELWRVVHHGMNAATRPVYGFGTVFLTTGAAPTMLQAIRLDGKGDVSATHVAWKSNKGVPTRPSPLLIDDTLYLLTDQGILNCVDPKTGTQVGQVRLGGAFSGSPVFADGRIYCANQDGASYVVAPGRAPKTLAVNKLADGCMASPAIVGKSIILRTKTHLYCIEKK